MAITTFSLPIDIPWRRIAFSSDMIDRVACDRSLPPRWRSSVAVFAYEPPADQQRTDGMLVSYLKVSCSITGFQADGPEIRIRERLARSGWTHKDLTERLGPAAARYYACHGAVLEVVIAPPEGDTRFALVDYPYFADFDPKKRELYEVVTETGETMSRSLEDVNVRLGHTTLQSHEVKDETSLGASLSAQYYGIEAEGSYNNTSGTKDVTQQEMQNVRTVDAAREGRETFSHTTQLTQMYHQLNSYHLGTNRASFFVLPRPHTLQAPATFVNGPREIEGIQEFMLIVVRPKEMEEFCVEAYLETAHLTGEPDYDWGQTDVPMYLLVQTPDNSQRSDSISSAARPGYIVDKDRVPAGPGYLVTSVLESGNPRGPQSLTSDYSVVVGTEQVTISGWVQGWGRPVLPGKLEVSALAYLKKTVPTVRGYKPGLMITGRAVCSCSRRLTKDHLEESVVFEKALGGTEIEEFSERKTMPIGDANRLGAELKRELLQSLSSADRYPRGTVSVLESQMLSKMMGTFIRHASNEVNPRLSDWPGIDRQLARRIEAYAPGLTRAQLLEMPLPQQVETFGVSFGEALDLRRSLMDITALDGPPPPPQCVRVDVPLVLGLPSVEAQAKVAAAGLVVGALTEVDSDMPVQTVIEQDPAPGTSLELGAEVTLRLASGRTIRIPSIASGQLSEVLCELRRAGLRSEPLITGQLGPEMQIIAIEPAPGTLVTPGTTVIVTLGPHQSARS